MKRFVVAAVLAGLPFVPAAWAQPANAPSTIIPAPRTTPSPGTEVALRRIIEGYLKDQPDLADMAPGAVNQVAAQGEAMQPVFASLGALKALSFIGPGPGDIDIYEADFEHDQNEWRIGPPTPDGKMKALYFSRPPVLHSVSVTWPVLTLTPRMLTADYQDSTPCFSPDGKTVLFSRYIGGSLALYVVPASGGEAKPMTGTPGAVSASRPAWSSQNMIAFTGGPDAHAAIWVMKGDGSDAHQVPMPSDGSEQLIYPSWYADGAHVAAMDNKNLVIRRVDVASGASTIVTDHAQVLTGMPSVSPDGQLIAFAGQKNLGKPYDQEENVIWLVDGSGKLSTLETNATQGRTPIWSPDGKRLAFESDRGSDGRYAIFLINRDGTGLTQVTDYALNANHAEFSPDGRKMVFAAFNPVARKTRIAIVDLAG